MKKNIVWFFLLFFAWVEATGQSVNFNTLPALSSVLTTTPIPVANSSGRWRKMTADQFRAFVMPRPVTRVAPSSRYVLGYVPGFDSLQYIPGGIMSQLPLGNVTITTDTSQFNIQTLGGLNFTTAAWGSGWVNRVSLARSGASTLSLLKGGQTISISADTSGGARLRWGNIGIQAKADSMFLTTENLDSIGVNEVLTVVQKFSDRAYVEFRSGSGTALADGDKGDITVSSSGTVWSLDNNVVGSPQLASTSVVAGTYKLASITVDQDGRIQAADDGILYGTATLDFPSTSAGGTQDLTITVTGAANGDVVSLGAPNGSVGSGLYFAWVSASNTVTVRFYNPTGGSINPTSGTFKVKVFP